MNELKILIIDDEERITEKLKYHLEKRGYQVACANTPNEGMRLLGSFAPEVVILDVMLPGRNGLDMLKEIRSGGDAPEVIMISGFGDMDMVIHAMRQGACDFIRKPFQIMDIQLAIERTGRYISLQNELQSVSDRNSLVSRELEGLIEKEFVGESVAIKQVLKLALKAAEASDVNVLITGENGTGKEIVARIIHYAGSRAKHPFVPVNSAAIPDQLLESEFFGHMKGAFTDARDDKKGFFELAHGGTLFLDEIADMPLGLQSKLLRVLEEQVVRRVGGAKEIRTDVRVISATNKDVNRMIGENHFRIDLYHRINTLEIHIPPLRERMEDLEPLLTHFVSRFAQKRGVAKMGVHPDAMDKLMHYAFPGNVRELRNMVERALILSEGEWLMPDDFPVRGESISPMAGSAPCTKPGFNLDDQERHLIEQALKETGMNQTRAAEILGVSRDALKRKIKKFGLVFNKSLEDLD